MDFASSDMRTWTTSEFPPPAFYEKMVVPSWLLFCLRLIFSWVGGSTHVQMIPPCLGSPRNLDSRLTASSRARQSAECPRLVWVGEVRRPRVSL